MNYIAYVQQRDQGCDYTIGCGVMLWELEATNYENAMAELFDKILTPEEGEDYFPYGPGSESMLESATLYEVSNVWEVPLEEWFQRAMNEKRARQDRKQEEFEKETYERLRRKFER